MLLPMLLLYVGAVLTLNGIWMSGYIADREIVLINLVVAVISAAVAALTALQAVELDAVKAAALTLMFTTNYLWVAFNLWTRSDGRGLGWFSLLVAITVTPEAIVEIGSAHNVLSLWLGLGWAAWAGLWFMYFLMLAQGMQIQRITARATILAGIFTAWLPGTLMLYGVLV